MDSNNNNGRLLILKSSEFKIVNSYHKLGSRVKSSLFKTRMSVKGGKRRASVNFAVSKLVLRIAKY